MKIKPHKDYWTSEEITNIVAERTGRAVGVAVKPGELVLDVEDLPDHERVDLETYFGAEHDLPTVAEREAAEEHKTKLQALISKFVDDSGTTINPEDIRNVVGALRELFSNQGWIQRTMGNDITDS